MSSRSSLPPASDQTVEIAAEALRAFADGYATGDWRSFLDLVTADVHFCLPVPPFEHGGVGRTALATFLRSMTDGGRARLLIESPMRTTAAHGTVVFECRETGHIDGAAIENRLALSFDIVGDRVCALREYLGVTSGLVEAAVAQLRS